MKTLYFLFAAWHFSYKLFFQALMAKDTKPVVEKSQVDATLYQYMSAAYIVQGVLLAVVLGLALTGPDDASVAIRVFVAVIEKGLFVAALAMLFKQPVRTLALTFISVSDVLSAALIYFEAPISAHLVVGIMLGYFLLRYMVKRS